jgi:hypothetical protein
LSEKFPYYKVYLKGNAKLLTEYFQLILNKKDVKVAYFGTSVKELSEVKIFSDRLGKGNGTWDPVAVIEEFS